VVDFLNNSLTTEAQRTQRLHKEEAPCGLFEQSQVKTLYRLVD